MSTFSTLLFYFAFLLYFLHKITVTHLQSLVCFPRPRAPTCSTLLLSIGSCHRQRGTSVD